MDITTKITITLTEDLDESGLIDALRLNPDMTLADYFQHLNEDFFARLTGTIDNHFVGRHWEMNTETLLDDTPMYYTQDQN